MTRRDFFKSMLWAPALAVFNAVEVVSTPPEPLDNAIKNKKVFLGSGGYVQDCQFVDSTFVVNAGAKNISITDCAFNFTKAGE